MSQVLVIFTLEYPNPLLDKEIDVLAKEFDKIYVLPGKVLGSSKLPPHVEVHSIFKPVTLSNPGTLLLKHIPMTLRLYGWALFKSGYRKDYIKYFKSFLGHLLIEAEKIKPLRQFIEEKRLQGALFYDYWLVDTTLALAELKRERIIQFSVSRAHGFDLYHERQFEEQVPYQAYRIHYLDAVFTISQHGYDYLVNRVPSGMRSKVKLSYLGINNFFLGELPQKSQRSFTLVSCSNIIPLKRIELLIDGLALSRLDIRWIHFGDGPLRDSLEMKTKSLPENVQVDFKGKLDNVKVLEFYQHHFVDLFVSVSETEGLPVSMIEAASYGIPILACGVNGVPEIVTAQTGVLLEKEIRPQQICDALEHTLLHQKFDRESIRKFCFKKFNGDENYHSFIKELKRLAGMELKRK